MDEVELNKLLKKLQTLKVLYVEDNAEVRKQTLSMFEDFFIDVDSSINGLEALEKFKLVDKFDLVITDINMPIMDGIEMSKRIREIDSEVQIIVMSAHNEDYIFEEIAQCNIAQYLLKPLNLNEFIDGLNKIYL